MLKLFDKTFFSFLISFGVILLFSFGVIFLVGYYDSNKIDSIATPSTSSQK
ncbi:MAG: hypothetical protein NUV47_02305 [Patescibacteria group bacterium]|nr:hypothetical protein [Patescibacteria group bacterium]